MSQHAAHLVDTAVYIFTTPWTIKSLGEKNPPHQTQPHQPSTLPPRALLRTTSAHPSTTQPPHTHPTMPSAHLAESGITIPSDSETYDHAPTSTSPSPAPSSTSSPLILYKPPTIWGLVRGAAINLLLPFVNGLMLGFGELVANEAAYRLGWSGTKVCFLEIHWVESLGCMEANDKGRYSRRIDRVRMRDGWGRAWR